MTKNYFCSCTANLGVVPLFLFTVFLFPPTFAFLALRMLFVLPVRDAITTNLLLYKISEGKHLAIKSSLVKIMLCAVFLPIFKAFPSNTLYLSKGEQKELSPGPLSQFSIGNKDVLGHKVVPQSQKFLLKGKALGFSDLHLWPKNGPKLHYKIHVLNKSEHSKQLALAGSLSSIGLETQYEGEIISVTGKIKKESDWALLKKIQGQNENIVHLNVELDPVFLGQFAGKIYAQFISLGADYINCSADQLMMVCYWSGDEEQLHPTISDYQKSYPIRFQKFNSLSLDANFEIKIKIIKIEIQNTKEYSLGADQINTTVQDIVENGALALFKDNTVKLKNLEFTMNTLAEPVMTINLSKPAQIEVGAEIPYQNVSPRNPNVSFTQWKFAGLKIQLKLLRKNNQFYLDYETEFSRPNQQSISTSKQNASSYIELDQHLSLFEIVYQGDSSGTTGIPLLKDIPLLGIMFRSSQKDNTLQKIVGVVEVKRKGN